MSGTEHLLRTGRLYVADGRGRRITAGDDERFWGSHCAGGNLLLQSFEVRVKSAVEAHAERHWVVCQGFDTGVCAAHIKSYWLLAKDSLAGPRCLRYQLQVGRSGGCDDYGMDVGIRECKAEV